MAKHGKKAQKKVKKAMRERKKGTLKICAGVRAAVEQVAD